jgi:hypothetical protein
MLLGRRKTSEAEQLVYDSVSAILQNVDDDEVTEGGRRALLTLVGAALKCNGLSFEQGFMYCCDAEPTLHISGLRKLVAHLLGDTSSSSQNRPYITDADKFTTLLRAALDAQVYKRFASSC